MDNANIMRLRKSWQMRLQHKDLSPEWQSFNAFLSWAEENGYTMGSVIRKINNNMPSGPCNCYIYIQEQPEKELAMEQKRRVLLKEAEQWDKTVAMFKRNLKKASIIAEDTLIHRIRSGTMPKEWYPQNS